MNNRHRPAQECRSPFNVPLTDDLLLLPQQEFMKRLREMYHDLKHKKCHEIPLHELIKQGIDINAANEDGTNRLQNAAEENNMEETCMLLYYGADVNKTNGSDRKVLDIALANYNLDIALLLANFCDDLSTTNFYNIYIALLSKNSRLSSELLIDGKLEETLVEYFKKFSYKIYPELISNPRVKFLADYVQHCDYSGPKFLDCLNTVLSFPNSSELVQNFRRKCNSGNLHNLLNAFKEKDIKRTDRTATIWTWAALGAQASIMNINIALYLFGFNEEVEALIYSAGAIRLCCFRILPLTIFILALEENYSTVTIFECFLGYWYEQGIPELISFSRSDIAFNAIEIVLNCLRYFSIPNRTKKVFLTIFKETALYNLEIVRAIKTLPRIPKLVELSRDQTRKYIREVYDIKTPYQFHDAVKNLEVPLIVKDIIRFKRPIYY